MLPSHKLLHETLNITGQLNEIGAGSEMVTWVAATQPPASVTFTL